ncbi:MAG: acyl-CoA-binding protein [Myxococcota bacterium]|jgi:acyl-CoA-binding protein|nr:acyl-CoA-binding protein [Myxococcota bacterium]
MATEAEFTEASVRVKTLTARPSNEDLLALYSLFKQASAGDASGKRPGAFNMVARAKFDAWSALRGTTAEDARQRYVDLVNRLLG